MKIKSMLLNRGLYLYNNTRNGMVELSFGHQGQKKKQRFVMKFLSVLNMKRSVQKQTEGRFGSRINSSMRS